MLGWAGRRIPRSTVWEEASCAHSVAQHPQPAEIQLPKALCANLLILTLSCAPSCWNKHSSSTPCSRKGKWYSPKYFHGLDGAAVFFFALKREKLLFLSVGMTFPQSETEPTVQASLQRADKEIKTALKRLMDSASLLVTLPPGMRADGALGLGPPGAVPSEHSGTAARPSVAVHEASTQTQTAGGHGRFGTKVGDAPWELRGRKILNVLVMMFLTSFFCVVVFWADED